MIRLAATLSLALVAGSPALAQASRPEPAPADGGRPAAFAGLGSTGKEPIKIDADRLDVFDKEQRAVFSGNVVAVQGDSTMKCTSLTVLYEQGKGAAASQAPAPGAGEGAIRRIECKGPVTVISKTQVATSDNATFDRVQNKITLSGNAALSDGPNVTRGERVVYDLNSSRASVEGGRVRAMIVPGSGGGPERKPAAAPPPARAATN